MLTDEEIQTPPKISEESPKSFWLCFALLFLAVVLFHGKSVPFSNEFLYLLRLEPNFLPNDWTFSSPANEHWLFNLIFSFPARLFSLETLGWTGRIVAWMWSLFALLKLGGRWEISVWKIAAAIFLWLAFAQSVVGDEWIFGGFEAKTIAYICLLFALVEFSKRRIITPSILLGLSFGFHPAVGLWAILAVGLVLLFEKIPTIDFVKVVIITSLFSLFGLIPLFAEQTGVSASSFDDWKFIVVYRVPWHLDLFQFSKSGTALIFVMLGFNCFAVWKSENFALRFLLKFQIALGAFFLLGLLLRWFEIFPLLRLMPMRLFPVFTPLFFIFTAFYFVPRLASKRHKIIVSLFVLLVVASLNPFGKSFNQARESVRTWTTAPDDFQTTSRWIAENTPPNSVVIQPPHRRDFWYFSKRASVVSFAYPTYNRLGEWRARIADLTDNRQISKGETANEEIETAYNQLSGEQIEVLKNKYAATHLVSRTVYSYPVIFETETYKVYRLP
ncbi:MAG: hypothetical protein LH472_09070 [Pyrinomonadaceae bacterium]|nr:hypothetical protein [Pyrinomonadaceae bacterium]